MSMVKAIKEYIRTCPSIDAGLAFNIDHIINEISYAVTFLPNNPTLTEYINGDKLKQTQFALTVKAKTNLGKEYIDNQELLEALNDWFELQNCNDNFPILTNPLQTAESIEIVTAGYLSDQNESGKTADYQIQCVFIYKQKGD